MLLTLGVNAMFTNMNSQVSSVHLEDKLTRKRFWAVEMKTIGKDERQALFYFTALQAREIAANLVKAAIDVENATG